MSYHPNRLVLESGHRMVVDHFSNIPGMRLALRPARKRLFPTDPEVPTLQVELSKPAFAALVPIACPDGKPLLVFETDTVSAGIRDLYRNADIPYIEADQTGARGMMRFERPGFSGRLQFDDRGDKQAIETVIRWAETSPIEAKGSLLRTQAEKSVCRALLEMADEIGVSVHHHVPFGYTAGYRSDLPKMIARQTIEMAVSLKPEVNPGAPVIMPIRIDSEPRDDEESQRRDECVADFVCSVGMPMAAVQPGDNGKLRLTYSLDGEADYQLEPGDTRGWDQALRAITTHAVCAITESIGKPAEPEARDGMLIQ